MQKQSEIIQAGRLYREYINLFNRDLKVISFDKKLLSSIK